MKLSRTEQQDSEDLKILRILADATVIITLIITVGIIINQYIIYKHPAPNNNSITDVASEQQKELNQPIGAEE